MSNINSDSDLDSDSDFENSDVYVTSDMKKVYQLQFVNNDLYRLTHVGIFKSVPSIELHKFTHKIDDIEFSCFLSNNFTEFKNEYQNNPVLFDLITMDIIRVDGCELSTDNSKHKNLSDTNSFGKMYKLSLSVEIEKVNLDNENKGNLMVWYECEDKRFPIKSNLTHPGNEKLPYYIIAELKNDKVIKLLKE
jgi:hypothetical protein